MGDIWNTSCKKCILWTRDNKSIYFLIVIISASRTCNLFFEFLVSVINHYPINGLHLLWDCFEWFCLQISSDAKYFFLSCPRHCDQGLIVVIVYYFQIWNKNEDNIIISRVMSSHMGPTYIETPYITMYIETPDIIISRVMNCHMSPVNILSWLTGRAIISPWRKRELWGEEGGERGLTTFFRAISSRQVARVNSKIKYIFILFLPGPYLS